MATFERCEPLALSWDVSPNAQTVPGVPFHNLGIDFDAPEQTLLRWWRRLLALPSGNLCGAAGAERRQLEHVMRRTAPDVVLCHFGAVALRLLPVARALQVPLVAHFHGHDISSSLRNNRYYRWSLRRSLRHFAAAVVVGSHQRDVLRSMGMPDEKIELIPCGAPTESFKPKWTYATDRCRFVTVSRLVEWKGVEYALRAFARARQTRSNVELHIVGSGEMEHRLRELARRLAPAEAVIFHGEKRPDEVSAILASSDVFVQHSLDHDSGWNEGFGVSIAEAAASGLPVLVTDCGGITDQVVDDGTGFITPQRDVTRCSEQMVRLADDEQLRQRLGQAGREHVCRHFDSTMLTRTLEARLLTVAEENPRHQRNRNTF
jgi:glycosyltransferase involved in cell wall biosynthesis